MGRSFHLELLILVKKNKENCHCQLKGQETWLYYRDENYFIGKREKGWINW